MVELSSDGGKSRLSGSSATIEVLPRDAVADGNIVRPGKRCRRGTTGVEEAGDVDAERGYCASCFTSLRRPVAAGQREEELEVQVESGKPWYIPFPLEEVNLDFQVVGQAPSSLTKIEVLIAASRKEKVEDRVAVAESAGLKPVVVDVESYAVLSAFELIERQLPDGGKGESLLWWMWVPT